MSLFGKSSDTPADAISVVAQIRAKAGHEDQVRTMFSALAAPSQKESGCLKYHVFEDKYYTGSFFTYEEWESEAALDKHLAGAREALNQAKSLLQEDLRISILKLLA